MRVGIDGRKIPGATQRAAADSLLPAQEMGAAGIFYRTVLDMSPRLDRGVLRAVRQRGDELGMYIESGLGKVNPYATPEAPELRHVGDGDILLGFRRMMEACADMGCLELWAGTANYKPYVGRWAYDRFRTDVDWSDQIAATIKFLHRLAPIARDLGIHINLETHEEITSFDLLHIIEAVGEDVVGVVFDTSNVLQRAEHPTDAVRRLAPYVRQTHFKDAVVCLTTDGVIYQERPLGQGNIDFEAIVTILAEVNPDLNLSVENAQPWEEVAVTYPTFTSDLIPTRGQTKIDVFDESWIAAHPDMTVPALAHYLQLAAEGRQAIENGTLATLDAGSPSAFGFDDALSAAKSSIKYLSDLVEKLGLDT